MDQTRPASPAPSGTGDGNGDGPPPARLRPVRINIRFPTLRTIAAMVIRDMSTASGRAPGGFLWAVAEPVAGILLLTIIVRGSFREPPLGTNFAIFYASGLLPFYLYTDLQAKVATAILTGRQLLSYPRVTLFDALAARAIVSIVTEFMISYIVLSTILLTFETRTTLDLPRILLAYSMAIATGLGFGTLNCYLWVAFPVWRSLWSMLSRPLLLVSGVMILPEAIPRPIRDWLWWNPLLHVTSEMHAAFYYGYSPEDISPAYVFGLALGAGTFGFLLLRRYYRDLLEL